MEEKFNGFPNWKVIHPGKKHVMYSKGSFHPKLWLLKFPAHLRVVISSANLYMGDWSIWGNQIWFKDFPIKSNIRSVGAMETESGVKRVFNASSRRIKNDF